MDGARHHCRKNAGGRVIDFIIFLVAAIRILFAAMAVLIVLVIGGKISEWLS